MFDAVIIGGGPGGYVAAIKGAQMGGRIALVEKDRLGGTCLNRGCIPTKVLVRTAEVLDLARRGAEFGVQVQGAAIDMGRVAARKAQVVSQLVGGVQLLLKSWGVEVIQGTARIASPNRVDVARGDGSTVSLDASNVVIATGSKPAVLPIPGADLPGVLVSEAALDLGHVPRRLAVIGAGVIGVEMACVFRSFGADVVLLEKLPGILPPVDEEISRRLAAVMKKRGIAVNTGVSVEGIGANADGSKRVYGRDQAGNPLEVDCDVVIVSVGRRPDFGGIDLDALGVEYDRGGIKVDEGMRTRARGIYAIGDVVGRTWLAHVASHEGIVAMRNIMGDAAVMDYDVVPACVFSSPEVAWVGITEQEARARGIQVKTSRFPFAANGRALILGEADGMVKVVAGQDGRLLGVHILGPRADDLIHEAAAALKTRCSAREMAEMIHSHPTLAEAVGEAFLGVDGSPIHYAAARRH